MDTDRLSNEARQAGIDDIESVRAEMIAWRDQAMKLEPPDWNATVFMSHVIWWLSQIKKEETS